MLWKEEPSACWNVSSCSVLLWLILLRACQAQHQQPLTASNPLTDDSIFIVIFLSITRSWDHQTHALTLSCVFYTSVHWHLLIHAHTQTDTGPTLEKDTPLSHSHCRLDAVRYHQLCLLSCLSNCSLFTVVTKEHRGCNLDSLSVNYQHLAAKSRWMQGLD